MAAMLIDAPHPEPEPLRAAITAAYRADEDACIAALLAETRICDADSISIEAEARRLVTAVREQGAGPGGLDAFLHEYELSSEEGVVLMCLAEALLRIPDAKTRDLLIRDKIGGARWDRHLGASDSLFVNASTWALMLTGRVIAVDHAAAGGIVTRAVARSGEPVIRQALVQGMRILGRQFVLGRTIGEALGHARESEDKGYRYSYDMLGEAARTMVDADRYLDSYAVAIGEIGEAAQGGDVFARPGISVKLSALHPRFEFAQRGRVLAELTPRLLSLAAMAREYNIGFTVDSEEADRLDITLDVLAAVFRDPALDGWEGLGLAVQAYQKRALAQIDWLAALARGQGRRLFIRLVKGAYWDTEIKTSQELGLAGYPVFTRKVSPDVSYLACMCRLLAAPDAFYPAFATHNAHTVAAVLHCAGGGFEFQRLHGMGEPLFDRVVEDSGARCRTYAPVGSHEDLLTYLVRRLLENGANTSFVNRIHDRGQPVSAIVADPVSAIVADPVAAAAVLDSKPHPRIPLPAMLYGGQRRNSAGIDLSDPGVPPALGDAMRRSLAEPASAAPMIGGEPMPGPSEPVLDPADRRRVVGMAVGATPDHIEQALSSAAQAAWDRVPAGERADILERAADLFEADGAGLMALAVREAGKTVSDAVAELREAVDFLLYYAARARADFAAPLRLPGPTGEENEISLHGRGVFACISPWNFSLAIFTGQIAAALAAGNAAIAKPAEQTPLIAARAVALLHEAGVPGDVLHLLPGPGAAVGGALSGDPRIAGIAFTGATQTAWIINRALAARQGPIAPLIAETGGQNAMIVDSSALAEQVVRDAVDSAFRGAGQRCSALRVMFVQDDVADRIIAMLCGAMAELRIGDPALLESDVGPIIDPEAREALAAHVARMDREDRLLARTPLDPALEHGVYFAPCAYEIDGIEMLMREVFGPILHVVRYAGGRLDAAIDAINATGYVLTLGVLSRVDSTIAHIRRRIRAGNVYVNRNQIGAIVGVQPVGGEGLSGTGPKAGGPRYLHRFATERTISTDTTAAGGNASLLSLRDEDG